MKQTSYSQKFISTILVIYMMNVLSLNVSAQEKILKAFIVSDAHFGWESKEQPSTEKQIEAMNTIFRTFPDLDVFMDTGDAHHNEGNGNRDKERGQWTDIILNPSQPVPFYYIAGNHEITHSHFSDVESITMEMGSISCRPYYSWDIKGIHFISMPQLVRTVFMNREILDWVELDLELNKDKTTIILSHNHILGTTSGDEPGYRGMVNSDDLYRLFGKYPNIKAWMHGHNHNYEIVKKSIKGLERLFVSNGRIGGFDPSRGAHGLGGIYFEITEEGMNVKAFSAEMQRFLNETDVNNKMLNKFAFSSEAYIKFKSSLNVDAPSAYSFGASGTNTNVINSVYNHHAASKGNTKLYIAGCSNQTLNEDPDFKYFQRRGNIEKGDYQLMGSQINRGSFEWLNPGVKIFKNDNKDYVPVKIPKDNFGKYCYFRVAPGTSYKIIAELDALSGGQELQFEVNMHDSKGITSDSPLVKRSERIKLNPGLQTKTFEWTIPNPRKFWETIYNNNNSDNQYNMSVFVKNFVPNEDLIIKRIAIVPVRELESTKDPMVIVDGRKSKVKGSLLGMEYEMFDIKTPNKARSVYEFVVDGNKRLNWLVQINDWDWQVRNASVTDKGKSLFVSGLRNRFTHKKEIVFVPAKRKSTPYFYKVRRAEIINVFPKDRGNDQNKLEVKKLLIGYEYAEVEIVNATEKIKVKGAESYKYKDNKIIAKVKEGQTIEIIN